MRSCFLDFVMFLVDEKLCFESFESDFRGQILERPNPFRAPIEEELLPCKVKLLTGQRGGLC